MTNKTGKQTAPVKVIKQAKQTWATQIPTRAIQSTPASNSVPGTRNYQQTPSKPVVFSPVRAMPLAQAITQPLAQYQQGNYQPMNIPGTPANTHTPYGPSFEAWASQYLPSMTDQYYMRLYGPTAAQSQINAAYNFRAAQAMAQMGLQPGQGIGSPGYPGTQAKTRGSTGVNPISNGRVEGEFGTPYTTGTLPKETVPNDTIPSDTIPWDYWGYGSGGGGYSSPTYIQDYSNGAYKWASKLMNWNVNR